jgi:two-component system OmpR family response regulator
MRVLVVEDEPKMAALLRRGLAGEGFEADVTSSGEAALARAGGGGFDAVVLDVMLPGIDGFETCRRLRADGVWTPVLMLTARDGVDDRVRGLEAGADDYLVKPFAFAELLARLRALLRRREVRLAEPLEAGPLRLDPAARRAWHDGAEIELSPREFTLLETFMRHPGQLLTRSQLQEQAWSYDYVGRSNVVDVYVRYLRAKVGTTAIETVRGAGYRLRA